MPKQKEGKSKKAVQKQKDKKIDDLTFGLKNKGKSAKVQKFVQATEKQVRNEGSTQRQRQLEEQKKQAKLAQKAMRKAAEAERDALFDEALLAVSKKTDKKAGKIEAKGRDGDDDDTKKGTSRAMKMMFQMDAQEMEAELKKDPNYVPTIEDEIEMKRQKMFDKLKKEGKTGTPVTEQTLKEWLAKKRKQRADEARKKLEAEFKKKKGGKGLSVLSGRDLYEYNKDLFVDSVDAADTSKRDRNDDDDDDYSNNNMNKAMDIIAENVQSDLFLNGDDEDLDLDSDDE